MTTIKKCKVESDGNCYVRGCACDMQDLTIIDEIVEEVIYDDEDLYTVYDLDTGCEIDDVEETTEICEVEETYYYED